MSGLQDEDGSVIRLTKGQGLACAIVLMLVSALITFGVTNAYMIAPAEPGASDIITGAENYPELLHASQLILDNYFDEEGVTPETLVEGAIRGVVSSTGDPYSMYFDASAMRQFQRETVEGEYSGIGTSILDVDGYVTIMVPFEGSPAATTPHESAGPDDPVGLRPGDRILRVEEIDVVGMTAEYVAELIRGPVGEVVTVEVERPETGQVLTFHIERDTIEIPTASGEVIEGDLGLIVISRFTTYTPEQVRHHMAELEKAGVTDLIVDLRNNAGGTLAECVEVASLFVPEGPVVTTVDREGVTDVREASGEGYPGRIVVLVNEFSASAAEILAGALRDRLEVPLVGQRTFGKGSVQHLYYLDPAKPSGMKITTERYLTPSGYSIEEEGGLQPDVEVAWPEDAAMGDPETDPQLRRAIELMRGQ
ncbi:MAG: S41 family peptidase [Bacillota bacterium]